MHTFHSEQWLPFPVERVFAFFANPTNLPLLMPTWQQAHLEKTLIVSPPPPTTSHSNYSLVAGPQTRLTLSFRPFLLCPIRLKWEAEIDYFVWNHLFSDTQLRGPFAQWHHTHTVVSETRTDESGTSISGTLLRDDIQYQLPMGKLGSLAQPLIALQLRRTFVYRHRRTCELLVNF